MTSEYSITCGTLGDGLLPEPALSALAARLGRPIRLYVESKPIRSLYECNPAIELVDDSSGTPLDPTAAWHHAIDHQAYFSTGYWPQVGIGRKSRDRVNCKVYLDEYEGRPWNPDVYNHIVICPFSLCCSSHSGLIPNKQTPLEWWNPVTDCLRDLFDRKVCSFIYSLGSKDDPLLDGTVSIRGTPLRHAAWLILSARLAIVLDSWSLHVAGGRTDPTICLNSANPDWFVRANDRIQVIQAPTPDWDHNKVKEAICRVFCGAATLLG